MTRTLAEVIKVPFGKHKGWTLKRVMENDFAWFVWLSKRRLHGQVKEAMATLLAEADIAQQVATFLRPRNKNRRQVETAWEGWWQR